MDNLSNDFLGRAFATMWRQNGMDRKLQLVSSVDIGILPTDAFKHERKYVDKAISFATDELSHGEAEQVFSKVFGNGMPRTYNFSWSNDQVLSMGAVGSHVQMGC
jgi:hypothetical protein